MSIYTPRILNPEKFPIKGTNSRPPTSNTAPRSSPIVSPGDDPSPIINPNKVGRTYYSTSPLAKFLKSKGIKNGHLDMKDPTQLVFIGETKRCRKYYINPVTKKPEYMLHPAAAKAWYKWRDEMKSQGIKYRVSSGYRNYSHQKGLIGSRAASAGSSPHGFAGALDFGNLYQIISGATNAPTNLEGRKNQKYIDIATIGAKYNFYNPWRLADNNNMEEIWHFEYWGPV